ncbi:MAG: phage tail protein [Aeromonas sp.]|uniref:phage tail protein n=1 Tax=Aeromonas sp. TaxID=647 RepID=UPI003F2DDF73
MSAIYFAIPTHAGQAKIANAIALGIPLKITHMAVGDGNGQPVTPNPAQLSLVREQRRAPLNTLFQDPLNPAQLVAEQIIPETVGGWWIREVGLFDDSGTLIAIANSPDTYKPQLSEGSGRTQTIRMVLIVSDTSAVELKIDPSVVLATRKYVDDVMAAHKLSRDHPAGTKAEKGMLRLATTEEAVAGVKDDVAVAPKQMREAMEALFDIICPIGQLIYYDGPTVPNERFIVYKAQSFDPARYPKLAKKWPTGRLPADLRSEFIRGADEGRGIVAGLFPMMSKPDQLRSHSHLVRKGYDRTNPGGGNYIQKDEECLIFGKGFSSATPDYDHSAGNGFHSDVTPTGGSETNPRYVGALILCRCE